MRQLLTGLRYALTVVGALAMVLTLVSVVPRPLWWIQATGFPRLQTLAMLALVLLGLLLLRWPAQLAGAGAGQRAGAGGTSLFLMALPAPGP